MPHFEPQEKRPVSPVFWLCARCKTWVESEHTVIATAGPHKGERLCRPCQLLQEIPYE